MSYDELINAIKKNDYYNIRTLLEKDADNINVKAEDNYALRLASHYGYLEVVKLLVEKGADIHANNDEALQNASKNGHFEIVKYLVEKGANIHTHNDYALCWASENGHFEIVKLLVEKGAYIHADDDFALRWASRNGHLQVVKYLLEKGANIHADDDGALRRASYNGHLEVVKYLLEKGSNIHAKNDFALRMASYYGHLQVVKYLVEKGANIHAKNVSALRNASENGHFEIVKYLVENGANIDTDNDLNENTLKITYNKGFYNIITFLLDLVSKTQLYLALSWACRYSTLQQVKKFTEMGADIHTWDDDCISSACKYGHLDIAKYLISQGANIHTRKELPLYLAAKNGHYNIVKFLLEQGADPDIDNYTLSSVLYNGSVDMLKLLLQYNAGKNYSILDAFDKAIEGKNYDIIKYLLENYSIKSNKSYRSDMYSDDKSYVIKSIKITKLLVEHHLNAYDLRWALNTSCELGLKDCVEFFINTGINIKNYNSPLIYAIWGNQYEIVQYLIEKGATFSNENLKDAVFYNRLNIIELFLNNGADIHFKNEIALRTSIDKGYIDIYELLLKHGATITKLVLDDIMKKDLKWLEIAFKYNSNIIYTHGKDLLYKATFKKKYNTLKYLLDNNIKDVASSLSLSLIKGYIDIFELLIKHATNIKDLNLVYYATEYNHYNIVKLLLNTYNITTQEIDKSLIIASEKNYEPIIDLLLKYNYSDLNQPLINISKHSNLRIVKLFVEKGANSFNQALVSACSSDNENLDIVKFLIEKGANNFNEALLSTSSSNIAEFLIEKGANNLNDALISATKKFTVVAFLLKKGADVHYKKDYLLRQFINDNSIQNILYLLSRYTDFDKNVLKKCNMSDIFNYIL